ncbi:MAG: flagellar assembly protein A [Clostridium sp.]|uniref:flagellar assembly protein A n=1 Tax=Clostridium sp. TaxID=1506 RepID=UPI003F3B3AC3
MGNENLFKNPDKRIIDIKKYNVNSLEISYEKNLLVLVNGKKIGNNSEINREDNVVLYREKEKGSRKLELEVSKDRLKVIGKIVYIDKLKKEIKEVFKDGVLTLTEVETTLLEKADRYRENEILKVLKESNINYGILRKNVELLLQKENEKIEIARGIAPVSDEEDTLKILLEEKIKKLDEDKVDYRNRNDITMVKKGEIIAKVMVGKIGTHGIDVFNKVILKKNKTPLNIKCVEGCIFKENKVIALIDGKVRIKGKEFTLSKILEINKNVNMDSGNVSFLGNLFINGNVGIGMTVTSGESLTLKGNGEECTLISKKDAIIDGSLIQSNVLVGMKDKNLSNYLENLRNLNFKVNELVEYVEQILQAQNNSKFGEMIKVIIEKKLQDIPKIVFLLLIYKKDNEEFLERMKTKFIGLGPLEIKSKFELRDIGQAIQKEIENKEKDIEEKSKLEIGYVQDTKINCYGDIVFTGKGEYISHIISSGSIVFSGENAIARGGHLKAKNNIECKVIGSSGGAKTILEVEGNGQITGELVYRNTLIKFGNKERIIEEDSKNLKAFLKNGEIEIEKIIL